MIPVFPDYVFVDDATLTMTDLENTLRSSMEVGPPKTRPIACKPITRITFTARIASKEKYLLFKEWFKTDIFFGSGWFLMNDPFDGVKRRMRFSVTEIPWSKQREVYSAEFQIEHMNE